MTQILTQTQALVVVKTINALGTVGGRPSRISIADGAVRVRCHGNGEIVVMRVDGLGKVIESRRFGGLSSFVREHQEAAHDAT